MIQFSPPNIMPRPPSPPSPRDVGLRRAASFSFNDPRILKQLRSVPEPELLIRSVPEPADPLLSFLAKTPHDPTHDPLRHNKKSNISGDSEANQDSLLDFGGHDILCGGVQRSAASSSASSAMQRMFRCASMAADGFGEERSSRRGDVRPNTWASGAAPPSLASEADISTASGEL